MNEDSALRPTAKELMEDPFFDKVRDCDECESGSDVMSVRSPTKFSQPSKSKINSPLRDITNTHSIKI
jgi:hypothetical protein